MRDIIEEVFTLKFKDKPDYDNLKKMFHQKIEEIKVRPVDEEESFFNSSFYPSYETKMQSGSDNFISDEFSRSFMILKEMDVSTD